MAAIKSNTREWAMAIAARHAQVLRQSFFVFQFPAGHWGFTGTRTDSGKLISSTSEVYPGVPVSNVVIVN
jgi:hypothetical protein